jgi:hypothetical protein
VKNVRRFWPIVLILVGWGTAAHADAEGLSDADRLRPQWQQLDADGDGKVALTEFPEGSRGFYARIDLDGNGELSLEEFVDFNNDLRDPRCRPTWRAVAMPPCRSATG